MTGIKTGIWFTYRVIIAEAKTKAVYLVLIQRVVIQHTNIHLPFFEVRRSHKVNAWRKGLLDLRMANVVSPNSRHENTWA